MKNIIEMLSIKRKTYPQMNKIISEVKGKFKNDNKDNIFLDDSHWQDIFKKYIDIDINFINNKNETYMEVELVLIVCLFTWQYNKFIYKFNKDIFNSIIDCEIEKNLPANLIKRLPHSCLYVSTENYFEDPANQIKIDGFFICLTKIDHKDYIIFLINYYHPENEIFICSIPILLDNKNINELIDETEKNHGSLMNYREETKKLLHKLFSITLYLCSNEPDISCHEKIKKEHQPIIKTRHGEKLLPAPKVKIFNVGDEIAKKIQEVNDYESGDKSVRAHIRKAHWHGYWIGKGRTEFKYNWIHPTLINVEN